MNFAGRKIERDPRTESSDLFGRQGIAANRLSIRKHLLQQTHGLKKFKPVRFITELLIKRFSAIYEYDLRVEDTGSDRRPGVTASNQLSNAMSG